MVPFCVLACAQRTLIKQIRKKKCKKLWNNKLATELNLRKARSFCVSQDGGPFHAVSLKLGHSVCHRMVAHSMR